MGKPRPFKIGKRKFAYCCPGGWALESGKKVGPAIVIHDTGDLGVSQAWRLADWMLSAGRWLTKEEARWTKKITARKKNPSS